MPNTKYGKRWSQLWTERGNAVRTVLGDTTPPQQVVPFHWRTPVLPGACALTFGPTSSRPYWLYMTLGLTQPRENSDCAVDWEFCVKTPSQAHWAVQLLFDLTTYLLSVDCHVGRGLYLPLAFFRDPHGAICAGLTSAAQSPELVAEGLIRGLYLWPDSDAFTFEVSSGAFGLMSAIGVTDDEDQLAQQATPPHLLLLLKEERIGQLMCAFRNSVLTDPDARRRWNKIQQLSHTDILKKL